MADGTKIEWTEATWNPITGCSLASPGCTNCYAMDLAGTRLADHPSRAGLTKPSKAGPVWTGEVRFNEQWLDQPLRWRKPRMIFVCAHGDLFHEKVPDEWIDRVFAVMALCPQHTFQVLTKRADRMRNYFAGDQLDERLDCEMDQMIRERVDPLERRSDDLRARAQLVQYYDGQPLPNVWLGVSVEDQQRADERIPDLLATPAAIRWISAEPLLGPVDFRCIPLSSDPLVDPLHGYSVRWSDGRREWRQIDWVVVGGESGSKARPMHPDWARSLRDQCAAAGVPFFFKQWGEFAPQPITAEEAGPPLNITMKLERVGKKRAGRLLDGVEHNGMPEARP